MCGRNGGGWCVDVMVGLMCRGWCVWVKVCVCGHRGGGGCVDV